MIMTKSVKNPVQESDGYRILVTRYPVRARKHEPPFVMEWARELAPSTGLLRNWKEKNISWREYERRYLEEMTAQQDKIQQVAERAKRETVTLL